MTLHELAGELNALSERRQRNHYLRITPKWGAAWRVLIVDDDGDTFPADGPTLDDAVLAALDKTRTGSRPGGVVVGDGSSREGK